MINCDFINIKRKEAALNTFDIFKEKLIYTQCFQLSGYIRKSGHFKIPAEVILTFLRKSGHFCAYRALGKNPDRLLSAGPDLPPDRPDKCQGARA